MDIERFLIYLRELVDKISSITLNTDQVETKLDSVITELQTLTTNSSPLEGYEISRSDDSSTPQYYGFVNTDGAWYILRINSGVYTYTSGASGFLTNWTNRAALTYDEYNNIF